MCIDSRVVDRILHLGLESSSIIVNKSVDKLIKVNDRSCDEKVKMLRSDFVRFHRRKATTILPKRMLRFIQMESIVILDVHHCPTQPTPYIQAALQPSCCPHMPTSTLYTLTTNLHTLVDFLLLHTHSPAPYITLLHTHNHPMEPPLPYTPMTTL